MADSVLRTDARDFAREIVFLCRKLKKDRVEYELVSQLLRSGTSIGANVHEAQYAQGTKDFISKLEIALKECNETEYWLDLLHDTDSLNDETYSAICRKCTHLRRMLIASVNTLKAK